MARGWGSTWSAFIVEAVRTFACTIVLYQECGEPLCSIRLLESVMAERIDTKAFVHQVALKMQTEDTVAAAWLEATLATLYDTFNAGKGVTLTGFGGLYVQPRGKMWAFTC